MIMDITYKDIYLKLADKYKSPSQIVRVVSEEWLSKQAFCPACDSDTLEPFSNNYKVADFYCSRCSEQFQLKSKKNSLGQKLVDGEHGTMITAIKEGRVPNFFFLTYNQTQFKVTNLMVIPRVFINLPVIEKRNQLSINARRAGWTGCNILLSQIADRGKLFVIENQKIHRAESVRAEWNKIRFLTEFKDFESRGWITDILFCIENIKKQIFNLSDMYAYEQHLKILHPENNNIQAKIRQQLQILRDRGVVEFLGKGEYRML